MKPKRPNTRKVYPAKQTDGRLFILENTIFQGEIQRLKTVFFLWRPLVFAPILPFENGDLKKKKRSAVRTVVLRSAGVERECGRKYIVFGQFGFRLPPLSSEH